MHSQSNTQQQELQSQQQQWQSQQQQKLLLDQHRRYYNCNKGCGHEIYFDGSKRTQRGKWIPISKETELPHQCQ
jgi:hypothetical protein